MFLFYSSVKYVSLQMFYIARSRVCLVALLLPWGWHLVLLNYECESLDVFMCDKNVDAWIFLCIILRYQSLKWFADSLRSLRSQMHKLKSSYKNWHFIISLELSHIQTVPFPCHTFSFLCLRKKPGRYLISKTNFLWVNVISVYDI